MYTPQAGIFALGTSSHTYLEFDVLDTKKRKEFASTISAIREPRTTTGGVNFVIGFRPELCRDIVPDDVPAYLARYGFPIRYGYVKQPWPSSMYQTIFATEP